MVQRRAWFLNFDADEELARPAGYSPAASVAARSQQLALRVPGLLAPGDVLLDDDPTARPAARQLAGRAFCPTPRALRALARAGAEPPPAPPLEVLRRVNHRRFCADLGQPLPGARYAGTPADVAEAVASPSPSGDWLLKRPFGFAGRGRRRVAAGELAAADLPWVLASLTSGEGLQVEPWVERSGDFSLHGHIAAAAAVVLGAPCEQRCGERGDWIETRRAGPAALEPGEVLRLTEAAIEAGEALAAAGYFGPFGIDAFRWRDERGAVHFNARCEINARYTMGWAIGMGDLRPDL